MLTATAYKKRKKEKDLYRIARASGYFSLVFSMTLLTMLITTHVKSSLIDRASNTSRAITILTLNLSPLICMSFIFIIISFSILLKNRSSEQRISSREVAEENKTNENSSEKQIKPIIVVGCIGVVLSLIFISTNIYSISYNTLEIPSPKKIITGILTITALLLNTIAATIIIENNTYIYRKKKENHRIESFEATLTNSEGNQTEQDVCTNYINIVDEDEPPSPIVEETEDPFCNPLTICTKM